MELIDLEDSSNRRTVATCKKVMLDSVHRTRTDIATRIQHKVPIDHLARQVSQDDFFKFTYILASDESNLYNLERIKPQGATADVRLFGSFVDGKAIADPYYGGMVSTFVLPN